MLRAPFAEFIQRDKANNIPLTTYDPAADLLDEACITSFMADAFETNDAGYIAHAPGIELTARPES